MRGILKGFKISEPRFFDWITFTDKPDVLIVDGGFVRVPDGPGLGIDIEKPLN
ncbi:hypothetical protein ACFL6H_07315 [Candidatus Latescibacterota bacterium]